MTIWTHRRQPSYERSIAADDLTVWRLIVVVICSFESQSIGSLKQAVIRFTSFNKGRIVIEILANCDSLREITADQVMFSVCHTVPTSFVLATVRPEAYWRLTDPLKAF